MDTTNSAEISRLLGEAKNSSEAIRPLYLHYKSLHKRNSISNICLKAGIPSKGYLSDIMQGQRTISLKYCDGIIRAFRLKGAAASVMRLMIQIDHEQSPEKVSALLQRKSRSLKAINIVRGAIPQSLTSVFCSLELFCRLGLYENCATRVLLTQHYGKLKINELNAAIEDLKNANLIIEEDGCLIPCRDEFIFGDSSNDSHIQFLHDCLNRVIGSVSKWYKSPDLAYFESSFISVKEENYRRLLPQIRNLFTELQSDLECSKADKLVLFNVQVLPVE